MNINNTCEIRVNRRSVIAAALATMAAPMMAVAAEPTIKIGAIVSASGPASFLGDPEQKTLELYVDQINAAGGVLGRKLELFSYDDAGDANKANAFTRRLILQDQVDAIIGASTTGSTMAMIPQMEAAKIPNISLAGGSVIVEPVKRWVFKIPHSDRMAAQKVLDDMKKRGVNSFALLSDTGGFGKSGRAETTKIAATMGMAIVEDEQFGDKDTDMTPQLTKIKSSRAQAILVFGTGQAPAVIARNYQQLAMKQPLYMSHSQASLEFVNIAGNAAEGIRMPSPALLIAQNLPDSDKQKSICLAYTKIYQDRFKIDVSTFGGYAYDGLLMLVDAMKRASSSDREKVRTALEATQGFVGVSGIYNMSATDHMGLDTSAFRMVEVNNGAFREVH